MKRGIAGSMIFLVYDRHALLWTLREKKNVHFIEDIDEIRPNMTGFGGPTSETESGTTGEVRTNRETLTGKTLDSNYKKVIPWYSDQVPPFNIVLVGVNELGVGASMMILGCEILNEGYGISIDDLVCEQQMTYVARAVEPWAPLTTPSEWKSLSTDPASSPGTGGG